MTTLITDDTRRDPDAAHTPPPPPSTVRRFRRPRSGTPLLAGILGVVLFLGILWPLVMLLVSAFRSGTPLEAASWTLSGFSALGENLGRGGALLNSIALAVATTILGVGLALGLALLERTNSRGRVLIRPLVLISVSTSAMFYAMGYSQLANGYTGLLNVWIRDLTGHGPVIDIESWYGLILVDSLHASAFVYLFLVGPVAKLNATYEEAAAMSGAGQWRTLRTITAPLLTPILLSATLVGLVSGLQSFDGPLILGGPADLSFLGTRMWSLINDHNPPLYAQAGAIAVVVLVALLALTAVQTRILRHRTFVSVTGKNFQGAHWDLRGARGVGGVAIGLYAILAVALPFLALVLTSFQPFPGVWQGLSLRNYELLGDNPNVGPAVTNTIVISAVGGAVATVLAVTIATLVPRISRWAADGLRAVTIIPLAMPGIVAAIAVSWAYAAVPGLRALYGTIWLMVIAVTVAVLPVTVQIAAGATAQLGGDLEEAARMSGAGPLRTLLTVTLPLILPSLIGSWLISAVLISGNLDAPLILSDQDTQTLSTLTYQMFSNQNQGQAAALLTLLIAGLLVAGLVIGALHRITVAQLRRPAIVSADRSLSSPATPPAESLGIE
ncbi:ABC transporter permease [Gordonia sp. NPDC003376]